MRRKLDRCLIVTGLLAIVSAALLSAGLFAIFSAVAYDDVELPSDATLEEVLAEGGSETTPLRALLGEPATGGQEKTKAEAGQLLGLVEEALALGGRHPSGRPIGDDGQVSLLYR